MTRTIDLVFAVVAAVALAGAAPGRAAAQTPAANPPAQGPDVDELPTDEPGITPLVVPAPPGPPPSTSPPATAPPARSEAPAEDLPGYQPNALLLAPRADTGDPELLSPGVALALSLGLTLGSLGSSIAMITAGANSFDGDALVGAGFTIGALGLSFGPSAGHFYAGDVRRGLGMGFGRLGAFGGSFGLGVLALLAAFGGSEGAAVGFLVSGIAAGGTGIGFAIWDIAKAPDAARRANARRRERATGLSLSPLITDAAAGQRGYGLALGGRF